MENITGKSMKYSVKVTTPEGIKFYGRIEKVQKLWIAFMPNVVCKGINLKAVKERLKQEYLGDDLEIVREPS